jgi:hypothetical protein
LSPKAWLATSEQAINTAASEQKNLFIVVAPTGKRRGFWMEMDR